MSFYHFNSDNNYVQTILKKIKDNGGYCPCSLLKDEDTKCMCKDFREQKEDGYCHCRLYYKTNCIKENSSEHRKN